MTVNKESWKLDDKEWMAKRKKDWIEFEYNIKVQNIWGQEFFPAFKEYFTCGEELALKEFSRFGYSRDGLMEMWLHAENNVDTFNAIASKMISLEGARKVFKSNTPRPVNDYKGLSHFNGKDLNIYRAIFSTELSREEYNDYSDLEFSEIAFQQYLELTGRFLDFFEREELMRFDYCLICVPYWKQCMLAGYKEHEYLQFLVEDVLGLLEKNNRLNEVLKELVVGINSVLEDSTLPPNIRQDIQLLVSQVKTK